MTSIMKTILKDIIILSAQSVAYRLAAPQEHQQGVIFSAVPTKDPASTKALSDENEPQARKVGF